MNSSDFWKQRVSRLAVLDPVERISEVLFGLIMVLTFTGAISVSSDGHDEIRDLLWAALGCNVAWGLVDAVMYLMSVLFARGYTRTVLRNIKNSGSGQEADKLLRDELPPLISDLTDDQHIQSMRKRLQEYPDPPLNVLLTGRDFLSAIRIFLLVFLCTLPVALPFGMISEPGMALRVSNGVALVMLFIGGFKLAGYAGFRKFITGFAYMLIGVVLVALTMALGG